METLRVVGMPPVWGLASPSPFGLKLETWLRMQGIPYRREILTKPPRSRTGKIPYVVRADGSLLEDSSIIIETLAREHGIDLTGGRGAEQLAREHVIRRTLEESLYFPLAWERWFDERYWPITRQAYFGKLGPLLGRLIPALIRRKVERVMHGQGTGRHRPARILELAGQDIRALSALLGEAPYFAGASAGLVDASAYGFFAGLLAFPAPTPSQQAVRECPNLLAYVERMREAYWREGAADKDAAA